MRTLLVVLLIVGCSMNEHGNQGGGGVALDAGRWQLKEVDGNPAAAEGWLEIDLARSRISGHAGCNRFEAGFEGSPEGLQMGPVGGTKMLCPEPMMSQERRVYEILAAAETISVDDEGMLNVSGRRGYLRAAPAKDP